jgi:hypothetical protein
LVASVAAVVDAAAAEDKFETGMLDDAAGTANFTSTA